MFNLPRKKKKNKQTEIFVYAAKTRIFGAKIKAFLRLIHSFSPIENQQIYKINDYFRRRGEDADDGKKVWHSYDVKTCDGAKVEVRLEVFIHFQNMVYTNIDNLMIDREGLSVRSTKFFSKKSSSIQKIFQYPIAKNRQDESGPKIGTKTWDQKSQHLMIGEF